MKRLLSLLVVIALMVSMIPNVFAAKEEVDFDELTGRLVVLEDITSFDVTLAEGSDGMIYRWTPYANLNMSLSWTAPEGTDIAVTVTQGETTVAAEGNSVSLPVYADQVVEIEIAEAAALAAAFTVTGEAASVPGSEDAPIMLPGNINNVTAEGTVFTGNTTWYQVFFTGDVKVTGTGAFNVIYNGVSTAAVNGVATVAVQANVMLRQPAAFAIDTKGAYTIELVVPVGTMENPEVLTSIESINVDIAAGNNQGYYYTWTATAEGTLVLDCTAAADKYDVNMINMNTYAQAWLVDSTDGKLSLEVAEGDVVNITVNVVPDADWNYPALKTTIPGELVLPTPPVADLTIVAQPESISRLPGEAASFTVVAEGQGLTYRWKYRNAGETSWRNTSLTGYNTATLNVSNAVVGATHNGRQYMCVITDENGVSVETEPATLTVIYMINDAKTQGVQIGETAKFTVKHSDPGATYRWQYKGNTASANWANTSATGNKTDTLSVVAKATNNRYMYRCNITLSDGTVVTSKEVYLNVVEDPAVISANPVDASGVSGSYVNFSIKAEGDGLVYQWQWSNDGVTWANTKSKGYSTATVSVKTNNFMSGRYYRCVVKTYNGTGWNRTYTEAAQLTVLPAADILETLPETITVKAGENAVLHIGADGEGLTYQWQWAKFKGNWKNTSMTGATTDTLTIPGNKDYNGRYYRVVITNTYGGYIETAAVQLFVE